MWTLPFPLRLLLAVNPAVLRHKAMTSAQRLARVFRIDVTRCEYRGGPVRIIASLTDPAVLDRILSARNGAGLNGPARGPPRGELALPRPIHAAR